MKRYALSWSKYIKNMRNPCLCLFIFQSQPHLPCGSYQTQSDSFLTCAVPSTQNALPAHLPMPGLSLFFRSQGNILFLEKSSLLTFFEEASPHSLLFQFLVYNHWNYRILVTHFYDMLSCSISIIIFTTILINFSKNSFRFREKL